MSQFDRTLDAGAEDEAEVRRGGGGDEARRGGSKRQLLLTAGGSDGPSPSASGSGSASRPLLLRQHDPRSLLRGFVRSDNALPPPQWFEGVEVPTSFRERHVFAPPPPPPSPPPPPPPCQGRARAQVR